MTEQQRKALNSLFMAILQVKEAFMPETVTYDERREALSRMLENFLITASMPQEGFIIPEIPRVNLSNSKESEINTPDSISSISKDDGSLKESNNEDMDKIQSNDEEINIEGEKKFGVNPYLNSDKCAFKRLVPDEERDLETKYPFVFIVNSKKGNFFVETDISDFNSIELKEKFSKFIPSANSEGASMVTTVEPGIVEKTDKIWVVIKPALLKYQ